VGACPLRQLTLLKGVLHEEDLMSFDHECIASAAALPRRFGKTARV
jgi:hypothetical protein